MKKIIIFTALSIFSISGFASSTEDNRESLLSTLENNYHQVREFSDPAGIGEKIQKAKVIGDNQREALSFLLRNVTNSRDLSVRSMGNLILLKTSLGANQVEVFKAITRIAKSGNDFNENVVGTAILLGDEISSSQVDRLIGIANRAKYSNGFDDTSLFMQVLTGSNNLN